MSLEKEVVDQKTISITFGQTTIYAGNIPESEFERDAAKVLDPVIPELSVDENFDDYSQGIETGVKLLFDRGIAQKHHLNVEETRRGVTGFFASYRLAHNSMGDPERRNKSNTHWKQIAREGKQSPVY